MPIVFDSKTFTSTALLNATTTQSHTCTGTNLLLVVIVTVTNSDPTSNGGSVSACTYNGVNLTRAVKSNALTDVPSEIWYLVNPPAGSHTVSVTMTGQTGSTAETQFDVGSFTGVSQTSTIDNTFANAGSGGPISDEMNTGANALFISAVGSDASVINTSGLTLFTSTAAGYIIISGGASVTTATWTVDGSDWCDSLVSFNPFVPPVPRCSVDAFIGL